MATICRHALRMIRISRTKGFWMVSEFNICSASDPAKGIASGLSGIEHDPDYVAKRLRNRCVRIRGMITGRKSLTIHRTPL